MQEILERSNATLSSPDLGPTKPRQPNTHILSTGPVVSSTSGIERAQNTALGCDFSCPVTIGHRAPIRLRADQRLR